MCSTIRVRRIPNLDDADLFGAWTLIDSSVGDNTTVYVYREVGIHC